MTDALSPADRPERGIPASVILPSIGVFLSEAFLYTGNDQLALAGHLLTLLGCVIAPIRFENQTNVFQVFALVPLFRLVNLGMPIFVELTVLWFPLVYAPIFPACYILVRDRAVEPLSFRPRFALLSLPVAIVLGAVLGYVEYTIIEPASLIPSLSLGNIAILVVVMFGFVGFVEELLFRGLLQPTLERDIGYWPGLLLTSALFGAMHSAYATFPEVIFAGVIGLVFGLVYDRTKSLLSVTFMHGALNVFLFGIIPLGGF